MWLNKCKRKEKYIKLPWNTHNNNACRHAPTIDDKVSGSVCGEIKFATFQNICPKIFINDKGKFSNFKWRNLEETTLKQVIKVNTTDHKICQHPEARMRRTQYSVVFSPNVHHPRSVVSTHQATQTERHLTKSSVLFKHIKVVKDKEWLRRDYTLQGTRAHCQCLCSPRACPTHT